MAVVVKRIVHGIDPWPERELTRVLTDVERAMDRAQEANRQRRTHG